MARFLPLLLLAALVLPGPAFAAEGAEPGAGERKAKLDELRTHYENMLRDAETETAARYFVGRLQELQAKRAELEMELAALQPQGAPAPAAPGLRRTDGWLRARILEKVKETDVALTDVAAWTRRELPEELVAWWAGLHAEDEPLDRDAALRAWEGRARAGWLSASYDSGTFIVVPPKRKPPKRSARAGSSAQEIVFPKPPTRDQWWANASSKQRTEWVLAYFVERSGLFDLGGDRTWDPCPTCHGEGVIVKVLATGEEIRYLCTRCGGAQMDASIRYR